MVSYPSAQLKPSRRQDWVEAPPEVASIRRWIRRHSARERSSWRVSMVSQPPLLSTTRGNDGRLQTGDGYHYYSPKTASNLPPSRTCPKDAESAPRLPLFGAPV